MKFHQTCIFSMHDWYQSFARFLTFCWTPQWIVTFGPDEHQWARSRQIHLMKNNACTVLGTWTIDEYNQIFDLILPQHWYASYLLRQWHSKAQIPSVESQERLIKWYGMKWIAWDTVHCSRSTRQLSISITMPILTGLVDFFSSALDLDTFDIRLLLSWYW